MTTSSKQQMSKPVKDPVKVLEDMEDWLPASHGQTFICAGVRFTIATAVDCFGLIMVQFGNEFEFTLLGLARFKHPREVSAKALCYIELQILMTVKPSEGYFKLQALLTSNSWILNQDCKLAGGFAVYVWFGGKHKDDFVITLGGYHPRFRRPDHCPVVPRLGLNWPVTPELSIKGGAYLAVTPSCFMAGAKLEATFQSGRLSVLFTAHLDAIIAWSPFHFEVAIGVSLRVEAAFFLYTLKVTISATVQMWGPPVGGIVRVDLTVISRDIPFGTPCEEAKPELIKSWAQFCRSFLNASEADKKANEKPVDASAIARPNLVSGRYKANNPALHRGAFTDIKPGSEPQPSGEQVAMADELVQWIARLVMLYPVPFHYLVAHPSLLPPESLRFFHVDDHRVDALVEGAFSLAVRSLADQRVASLADLQSALSKIVYQHRLRLQGKNPTERYMETPKSGFLLRSSIVTDWPGVKVTATTSAARSDTIPEILRLEQIADRVLFCLARGSLNQVTFREPREGLTFGVNTDGMLKTFNVKPDLLRADARDSVVNVAALRIKLGNKIGSAEFALRMIRMPEEQVIKWG